MSGVEIIGLAASVLQLADVGLRLSVKLFTFTRKVKSADKGLDALSQEISLTGAVLQQLGTTLTNQQTAQICSPAAIATAKALVINCEHVFDQLNKTIEPHGRSSSTGRFNIFQRVNFTLVESQIAELKANLERLKSSLLVMLNVLILAEQVRNREALPILQDQHQVLQRLIEENTAHEKRYEAMAKLVQDRSGNHTEHVPLVFNALPVRTANLSSRVPVREAASATEPVLPPELQRHRREIVDHASLVTRLLEEVASPRYRLVNMHQLGLHKGILSIHWDSWTRMRQAYGYDIFLKLFAGFDDVATHWQSQISSDEVTQMPPVQLRKQRYQRRSATPPSAPALPPFSPKTSLSDHDMVGNISENSNLIVDTAPVGAGINTESSHREWRPRASTAIRTYPEPASVEPAYGDDEDVSGSGKGGTAPATTSAAHQLSELDRRFREHQQQRISEQQQETTPKGQMRRDAEPWWSGPVARGLTPRMEVPEDPKRQIGAQQSGNDPEALGSNKFKSGMRENIGQYPPDQLQASHQTWSRERQQRWLQLQLQMQRQRQPQHQQQQQKAAKQTQTSDYPASQAGWSSVRDAAQQHAVPEQQVLQADAKEFGSETMGLSFGRAEYSMNSSSDILLANYPGAPLDSTSSEDIALPPRRRRPRCKAKSDQHDGTKSSDPRLRFSSTLPTRASLAKESKQSVGKSPKKRARRSGSPFRNDENPIDESDDQRHHHKHRRVDAPSRYDSTASDAVALALSESQTDKIFIEEVPSTVTKDPTQEEVQLQNLPSGLGSDVEQLLVCFSSLPADEIRAVSW